MQWQVKEGLCFDGLLRVRQIQAFLIRVSPLLGVGIGVVCGGSMSLMTISKKRRRRKKEELTRPT